VTSFLAHAQNGGHLMDEVMLRTTLASVCGLYFAFATCAIAQTGASASASDNDGTDPTELAATASVSYEHLDLRDGTAPTH
jgi:hypothetical protein